ncbi:LysR family transcriptional regulator [Vibrio campbellii]|uniref:LysR family transcriptional regulator n=1 Tax=Vibrio campbellii TaxID=680 RepID=A0AAE9MZW3_9VIBR|nr:LysR family transcriptional regulator [Vibrio campbellii]UTZ27935.1 LysR family transcriptional regulator [Vibrio campbellii]
MVQFEFKIRINSTVGVFNSLKSMAIFAEVVKKGSFREAAKSLSLSPSVISYHITQLEKKVGAALLYRSTRKLALSNEGEQFYEYVEQMLHAANQGLELLSGQDEEPSGEIKLSLPTALSGSYINNLIAMFANQFPQISLKLIFTDTHSDIIEDGFDLALRAGEPYSSNLKARKIGYLERVLVCAPSYFEQREAPKKIDELSKWNWIKLEQLSNERTFCLGKVKKVVKYQYQISVNSVEAMHHYCLLGLGLATLTKSQVSESIEIGELIHIMPDWKVEPIPLYALWPNNLTPKSKTKKLIDFLATNEQSF